MVLFRTVLRLIVTANIASSPIFTTVMMEALRSSETSFLHEQHGITSQKTAFFIVRRENLRSYIALIGWAL
jgi:hypothetical protein